MSQVDEVVSAWERFVHWLTEYAPASALALQPPATEQDIAHLEESLGFEIPDVLDAWLRMNNGSTAKDSSKPIPGGVALLPHIDSAIFPGGGVFLGCKEIERSYAEYLRIARDIGDDDYWKPSWIPIIQKVAAPYGLILEARQHGDTSPVLRFSEGDYPKSHLHSLVDFLHPLADALEANDSPDSAASYSQFSVVDGRLVWAA